ncbi:MAG TPA: hypothetical protein VGH19_13300 [Verrucomicrobiae bacterium]
MSPAASANKKRRWLITLSVLLLLATIFWWSRSGPTELDRYKAQLIAQGEIFDLDQIAPKRTGSEPDGDAPLEQAVKKFKQNIQQMKVGLFTLEHSTNSHWRVIWYANTNALTPAQRAPLWQQMEADMENRRADLLLLSQALKNPPLEKGGDYRDNLNYPKVNYHLRRSTAYLLQNAVIADTHARRGDDAATSMIALFDLTDLQREEWSVVNQVTRPAITSLSLSALNFGLESRIWSEPQLSTFQRRLENISLVTNFNHALLYERAYGVRSFKLAREESFSVNFKGGYDNPWAPLLTLYWHSGGQNHDEHLFLRTQQERLDISRVQAQSPHWSDAIKQLEAIDASIPYGSQKPNLDGKSWLTQNLTLRIVKAFSILALAETRRQQAIVATALERHRLKHGHYPDTLAKLIPDFLAQIPHDPMDGRPLRYRLNPDGTFTLWSIGFDGKDDGGDFSMPDPKKQNFPQDARDLAWPRLDPIDLPPNP